MVACIIFDLLDDVCRKCDRDVICPIINAIEEVFCRTYVRYLLSIGDPYIASVYSLYLVFTPSILLDAASLALTIKDIDNSWFETFILISGAYMLHTLSRDVKKIERPVKTCVRIRYSSYVKLKQYYEEKIMKIILENYNNKISIRNPVITPISLITIIISSYICSIDREDPIQHIINVLQYSINEETLKTISEYNNTQTITA